MHRFPQVSILGLLFFDIFLLLFLFASKSENCDYADYNTVRAANKKQSNHKRPLKQFCNLHKIVLR